MSAEPSTTTIADPCPAKISVLEALASKAIPTGPNMSNKSTAPQATDFDDQ